MKIKYRLPLFFLVVILLGALIMLFLVRRSTENMFRSFVFTGDSEKAKVYAALLGDYYQTNGGWDDVESFLRDMPLIVSRRVDTRIHGLREADPLAYYPASTIQTLMADRVVLADLDGIIVADTASEIVGSTHPRAHLAHGIPVMAQFERRGTVLVGSMIDSSLTGVAERFLQSITRSLFYSTIVSVIVALFLGILFTLRITRPLASLERAARTVASGDLGLSVSVSGNDELAGLSVSFNEMTAELKRLDEAKKRVVADSAHELRTPVSLIQGLIEGMIDGIFPLDVSTLTSVHEETLRLSRLIDTLRELESIESGDLQLTLEGVDVREMIRRTVALFSSAASAKGVSLITVVGDGRPTLVTGDSLRLEEVLYNLLSNAIKYTPTGGTVRVLEERGEESRVREDGRDESHAGFSVEDSGPGIAPEERERIFERFYRTDKSRASESGGRGLGLAIASEIVKAHGGTLTVAPSDLGGSRFTVRLSV